MKKLILFLEFYHKSYVSVFILLIVMTLSIFYMVLFIGNIKYMTYTKDFLTASEIENSLYFMPVTHKNESRTGAAQRDIEAQNFAAVDSVVCPKTSTTKIGGKYINVEICDTAYIDTFNPVDVGKWLNEVEVKDNEIVVCGYLFSNVKIGAEISFYINWDEEDSEPVYETFKVVGKKKEPSYLPSMGAQSNAVSALNLFTQGHNTVLIKESDFSRRLWGNQNLSHENCFIKVRTDSSEIEKEEVKKYLLTKGSFITYENILKNTDESIALQLKKNLPLPLFFIFVSTVSLISISVLLVAKKFPEHSIYALCGCSRKQSFLYLFSAVGTVGLVAGCLNALFIISYPSLFLSGTINLSRTIIDSSMLPYIITYTLACVTLSVFIPYLQVRKKSPIQVYRREQK